VAHHLAIYTGSFDPISYGHLDILRRSRGMFDEVVLAIGRNPNKEALFTFEERMALARTLVADLMAREPAGATIRVEHYTGLTAITNRQVAGIETVFIVTGESFAYTSSSLIKQIAALGGSLDALATLVPPAVVEALRAKRRDPTNPIGKLARDGLVE
jgi:pantetheine-phosphate adenylyltransferase